MSEFGRKLIDIEVTHEASHPITQTRYHLGIMTDHPEEQPTIPPESTQDATFDFETVAREPSDAGAPSIGSFGDYEVLHEIARGGMGVVYKARDTKLNRVVALKMIRSGQLASPEDRARFQLEAEAAAKLDHPGITPIYEIGEHQGQPFFVMKLIEGGSLADHLHNYVGDPKKAARLVADIAHAVHHAHQRATLHRDLKPNNILLDEEGNPLVTDFGLAKMADRDSGMTQTGAIVGTPGYMPPEQAASGKNVTTAADIYSLGAILFATLTGRPPFEGDTPMATVMQVVQQDAPKPTSINSKIPLELELICMKCLSRDPKERYSSADEFAADLESWLIGEPISVKPTNPGKVAWRWYRRNLFGAQMGLMCGLPAPAVLIVISCWLIYSGLQGTPFTNPLYTVALTVLSLATLFGPFSSGLMAVKFAKSTTWGEAIGVGALCAFGVLAFVIFIALTLSIPVLDMDMRPAMQAVKLESSPLRESRLEWFAKSSATAIGPFGLSFGIWIERVGDSTLVESALLRRQPTALLGVWMWAVFSGVAICLQVTFGAASYFWTKKLEPRWRSAVRLGELAITAALSAMLLLVVAATPAVQRTGELSFGLFGGMLVAIAIAGWLFVAWKPGPLFLRLTSPFAACLVVCEVAGIELVQSNRNTLYDVVALLVIWLLALVFSLHLQSRPSKAALSIVWLLAAGLVILHAPAARLFSANESAVRHGVDLMSDAVDRPQTARQWAELGRPEDESRYLVWAAVAYAMDNDAVGHKDCCTRALDRLRDYGHEYWDETSGWRFEQSLQLLQAFVILDGELATSAEAGDANKFVSSCLTPHAIESGRALFPLAFYEYRQGEFVSALDRLHQLFRMVEADGPIDSEAAEGDDIESRRQHDDSGTEPAPIIDDQIVAPPTPYLAASDHANALLLASMILHEQGDDDEARQMFDRGHAEHQAYRDELLKLKPKHDDFAHQHVLGGLLDLLYREAGLIFNSINPEFEP